MAQTETKVLPAHIPLPSAKTIDKAALTREALADVDSAQVIDHRSVQEWASGLSNDESRPMPR